MRRCLAALWIAVGIAPAAGACPDESAWKAEVLERLDAIRHRGGTCGDGRVFGPVASTLSWNASLAALAARQAAWMADQGRLMHHGPQGESLAERARQSHYAFAHIGENVAHGFERVDPLIEAWRASEAHCRILLDPAFTELGMACHRGPTGAWWTLVLGQPRAPAGAPSGAASLSAPRR